MGPAEERGRSTAEVGAGAATVGSCTSFPDTEREQALWAEGTVGSEVLRWTADTSTPGKEGRSGAQSGRPPTLPLGVWFHPLSSTFSQNCHNHLPLGVAVRTD